MFAKPSKSANFMMSAVLRDGLEGSQFFTPAVGDVDPARVGLQIPIGNASHAVTNYEGNKFTRGWLAGEGGADVDMALGSTAFDIRPANYNNRVWSDFCAVVPQYGAAVAGLANWDVNAPGRTWNPLGEASAEFIPTTWNHRMEGLDVTSGFVGPRVASALDPITSAPLPQFFSFGQMQEGADAQPSHGDFWKRPPQQKIVNGIATAQKRAARSIFAAGKAPSMML